MKQYVRIIIFSLTLFWSFISLQAQSYQLTPAAKASVLTCGKGDALYSLFGHTALRIKDSVKSVDVVFNYGMFDFKTPNFYLKFIKGDLQYFVDYSSYNQFIYQYEVENRDVFEQELNFNATQVQSLFDELNASLFSSERFYTYKFIDKNCTTMVADKIDSVLGGKIITKKSNTDISYRAVLNPYLEYHFYEKLGINILFGHKTDLAATQLFLPLELFESLNKTKIDDKSLVKSSKIIVQQNSDLVVKSWWNSLYTFVIILFLVIMTNNSKVYLTYFFFLGLLGILLATIGLYSLHKEVLLNYNILLFNPLLLFLIYCYLKNNHKWFKFFCYTNIGCLVIYLVFLLNKVQFITFLPLITTSFLILWRLYIKIIPAKTSR